MQLADAIREARHLGKRFRRAGWSHPDWLVVRGTRDSYMGGALHWETGERVTLFWVEDLVASDWVVDDGT